MLKEEAISNADGIAIVNIESKDRNSTHSAYNELRGQLVKNIKGALRSPVVFRASPTYAGPEDPKWDYPIGSYLVFWNLNPDSRGGVHEPDSIYGQRRWDYSFLRIQDGKVLWPTSHNESLPVDTDINTVITEISDVLSRQRARHKATDLLFKRWSQPLDGPVAHYRVIGDLLALYITEEQARPVPPGIMPSQAAASERSHAKRLEIRRLSDGSLVRTIATQIHSLGPAYNELLMLSCMESFRSPSGSHDLFRGITAIDITTGDVKWRSRHSDFVTSESVDGDVFYVIERGATLVSGQSTATSQGGAALPFVLHCLNAATGESFWSLDIPATTQVSKCLFDDRHVYLSFGLTQFFCVSKEAQCVLWSMDRKHELLDVYGDSVVMFHGEWGKASSFAGYSVTHGRQIWRAENIYYSLDLWDKALKDSILYANWFGDDYVRYFGAIQIETGNILWQIRTPANSHIREFKLENSSIFFVKSGGLVCLDQLSGSSCLPFPLRLPDDIQWGLLIHKFPLTDKILLIAGEGVMCLERGTDSIKRVEKGRGGEE